MFSTFTIFIIILVIIVVAAVLMRYSGYHMPIIGGFIAGALGACDCGGDDYEGGNDYEGGDDYADTDEYAGAAEGKSKDYDFAVHMKEPWIDEVISGKKTIEGRKNMAPFSEMKPGNILKVFSGDKAALVEVKKINKYSTIEEFVDGEDWKKVAPGLKKKEEVADLYNQFNKAETVAKYGFLGIHIELVKK